MNSTISEKIGSAEEEALKRRERIRLLKRKAQEKNEDSDEDEISSTIPKSSYQIQMPENNTVSNPVSEQVRETIDQDSSISITQELDLNKLAPRKIDWDLKRGIEKKLEILKEKTNCVIMELIAERIKLVNKETNDD